MLSALATGANLARHVVDNSEAELVGVCDVDSAASQRLISRYPGIAQFGSLEEVLAQPSVEAVVIATPSGFHYEQALAALEAGKHVLVEKPMTSLAEQATHLVQAAEDAGGDDWRYGDRCTYREVPGIADSGCTLRDSDKGVPGVSQGRGHPLIYCWVDSRVSEGI